VYFDGVDQEGVAVLALHLQRQLAPHRLVLSAEGQLARFLRVLQPHGCVLRLTLHRDRAHQLQLPTWLHRSGKHFNQHVVASQTPGPRLDRVSQAVDSLHHVRHVDQVAATGHVNADGPEGADAVLLALAADVEHVVAAAHQLAGHVGAVGQHVQLGGAVHVVANVQVGVCRRHQRQNVRTKLVGQAPAQLDGCL